MRRRWQIKMPLDLVLIIGLSIIMIIMLFTKPASAKTLPKQQQIMANKIARVVINKYDEYGVLPSVAVSQAFIESTLGMHKSNKHNYFGIRSGAVGYSSFEEGVEAYLKVINNGRYDGAIKNKSYKKSLRHILNGGYCDPVGSYYSNAVWSIQTYGFHKYDEKLWKEQREKKEKARKAKWKKKYRLVYDENVPEGKVVACKDIIHGGCIATCNDDFALILDVIPEDIRKYELRVNIPEVDGKKVYIFVYEEVKG